MNLFDAHSIVSNLGLAGVLSIVFAETGLLIGLAFPGDSLLFIAGVAASGSGAAILGDAHLPAALLFTLTPIAAILGGEVGICSGINMAADYLIVPMAEFLIISELLQLKSGFQSMELEKRWCLLVLFQWFVL